MSEELDSLNKIGAQRIHEATHISRKHVESILNEDLEDMTKVQYLGFLSILEREFSLDLSGLKNRAVDYYKENEKGSNDKNNVKVFAPYKKEKNLTLVYIILAVVIFASFFFFSEFSQSKAPEVIKVDNSAIESAKYNLSTKVVPIENNSSVDDANKSQEIKTDKIESEATSETKSETLSFKIIPKYRVWLGYIDLETHKKQQKTFLDEFDLDADKDYILAFGHGYITFDINGEKREYKNYQDVRFSYINSELKEITLEEFKTLNKGDKW